MLERHTDLLAASNALRQAHVNLQLQRRLPYPDLQTNTVIQHDNAIGLNQFNLQLSIQLPLFDRNQGNVRAAAFQISSAGEALRQKQNDLLAIL